MKMRILLRTVILALAVLILTGCCKPALVGDLPVTLHPQETGMWCWAASGQMVMDYLGTSPSQCTQANNRFGRTDCCTIDLCPLPTEPSPASSPRVPARSARTGFSHAFLQEETLHFHMALAWRRWAHDGC